MAAPDDETWLSKHSKSIQTFAAIIGVVIAIGSIYEFSKKFAQYELDTQLKKLQIQELQNKLGASATTATTT